MHASNHKSHPSVASSLPGATSTSAAIRRGKLEISNPILLPQTVSDGPRSQIVDGQGRYKSPTAFAQTDTWPRRMTPTSLQGFSQHGGYCEAVLNPSESYNSSNRTSAALTNNLQSMSSVPSTSSARKSGGLRATFRRMFGSKRTRDSFSTGVNEHRMVGHTDSPFTGIPPRRVFNWTKLSKPEFGKPHQQCWFCCSSSFAEAVPSFRGAHSRQSTKFARA